MVLRRGSAHPPMPGTNKRALLRGACPTNQCSPACAIHPHLLYLRQNHVLLFMMRPRVADQLTATADSLSSRPQTPFPCSSMVERAAVNRQVTGSSPVGGVQPVGLKWGRPVCLQADPRETPCGRVVAGVVRSRVCGESERVGSERSSSRPTATRLSGALCSV